MPRVLQVSDLHVVEDPSAVVYGTEPEKTALEVVRAASDHGPFDAVVATGDVTDDGKPSGYERVLGLLESIAPVVRWTPGNHDDLSAMRLTSCLARVTELGTWDLLCVDSHWPGRAAGRLQDAELRDLTEHVEAAGDRHILVALHHPPIGVCPNPDCNLEDADSLLDLIQRFPSVRGVISGHVHQPFDIRRGHVRLLGAPSTCVGMHHRSCRSDRSRTKETPFTDDPPAARVLELHDDGEISTWVVAGDPAE